MPGFSVSPLAVVNQIKSNLQDRYESGYPILKELLQNADDAEARRFRLDALSGWPDAGNPLLRGPGLLVVNDGTLTDRDRRGILAFGESVKAADRAAIGKFGLGQKAVFHLCDAFIVHAVGVDEPFTKVVNPFLDFDVAGNVTRGWDHVSDADAEFLRQAAGDMGDCALLLWLPLRRAELIPAPDAGFSTIRPDCDTIVKELARTDDLRVLLTALRHLESIDIRRQGLTLCCVRVGDTQERLRGPDDHPCTRFFRGTIATGLDDPERFVGREATIHDQDLARLRCSDHWPKTISALSAQSEPEKGEQHGAVTLLRTGKDATQSSGLRISWAVFLPISETESIVLPIEGADLGQIHLLLHGYFFLDSGRRRIEGLANSSNDEPADEAGLRRAWNTRLRDTVVLPLVPALLKDAFDHGMLMAKELAHLAAAVARSPWFEANRIAICGEKALVRVLDGPRVPHSRRVRWQIVSTDAQLRPLPAVLADNPELADKLFDGIDQWAHDRNIELCIDRSASLTAQPMGWLPEELGSLFAALSAQAFQSEPLAALLADLLSEACLNDDARSMLAPHLVSALRTAMLATATLAPSIRVSRILRHVPRDRLFSLPKSVELRAILRALASSTDAAILPVRGEWLQDADRQSPAAERDLNALLHALAPLVERGGNLADQAATAALALLGGHQVPRLASRQEFQDIKILRARDPLTGSIVVLSFAESLASSRQRVLFRRTPDVESRLRTLVGALPDTRPLVVDVATTDVLGENEIRTANKKGVLDLIKTASVFGPVAERARMITLLSSLEGADEPAALRRLCVGDRNAGAPDAALWNGDELPVEIERIIALILEQRENEFLVPSRIVTELTGSKRKKIPIRDLDMPRLESLIENGIDALPGLQPSEPERKALLKIGLRTSLLRRLPIHDRSDGKVGSAQGLYWEDDQWSIPDRFRELVVTVRLFDDPETRSKQKHIIPAWSPHAQIEVALSQAEPHRYQKEILDAVSACRENAPRTALKESLRTTRWLVADGRSVAPKELLRLPAAVDEASGRQLAGSSRYISVGRLPEGIQAHPGFRYAQEELMPDRRSSISALAQMIAVAGLRGRLGAAAEFPIDQFTELAEMGADLRLPGWPLLAAVLASVDDDADGVRRVAESFHEVSDTDPETAGLHLDALAEIADRDPVHGEAAERAYRYGFEAIGRWETDALQRVLRSTRVPTKSGGWRTGKQVLAEDNGVAATHVLARVYAPMLPPQHHALGGDEIKVAGRPDDEELNIEDRRRASVDQHRAFLECWRGSIPSELVAVYLSVVGRHNESLQGYRSEWTSDTTMNVDRELDALGRYKGMRSLYLIEEIKGQHVEAVALSGDRFSAPLGDNTASGLVVGNRHKHGKWILGQGEASRTRIVVMQVRRVDHGVSPVEDRVRVFRDFIETAAAECLTDEAMESLRGVIDRAAHVDQTTLHDTQRLLHDRLPMLLAVLKLSAPSRAHQALKGYEEEETFASDDAKVGLKKRLWQSIREPAAAKEVLTAVRDRIRDQGYGVHRVLFEVFQNADDAYVQRGSDAGGACFRVDFGSPDDRRLWIAHWGRRINHPGSDVEKGRRLGYDRDLLNMLVPGFSEKRSEEGVTGKFGLGFKCVHLLSDSVGVASGFVALRIVGGILPEPWSDGRRLAESLSGDGRKATVIDIPYTTDEMAADGRRTEHAFRNAMTWLPAVARQIRRIEVLGGTPGAIDCEVSCLPGMGGDGSIKIKVVVIRDIRKQTHRALRFDLGGGYGLLLRVGAEGAECFEPSVGRVWNLAPLEESVSSCWLLNGPFPVDPGRGRLAGSIEDRQEQFVKLGGALGERLLSLHDLVENDWKVIADTLDLRMTDSDARERFWSRLFDVVSRDLDDDLARHLHARDRGYGLLAAECLVVPTRLPAPFDGLVRASCVEMFTHQALAATAILEATGRWSSAGHLIGRVVTSDVATRLRKLGFDRIHPTTLSELLLTEMGEDKRIDVERGIRLGQVIEPDAIEKEPLHQERRQILEAASQACFRARDDTWRHVRSLSSKDAGGDDESLLCDFAPDEALLHEDYREESLVFFKVARMQSGYGPGLPVLRKWVDGAQDEHRRRAVLRYLGTGRQGPALAQLVWKDPPSWMADVSARFSSHPLLDGWTDVERKKLVVQLNPERIKVDPPPTPPPAPCEVSSVLQKVHDWWMAERQQERGHYAEAVYPQGFNASSLADVDGVVDRTAWFTMFALACYQLFGRSQDEPHKSFIEAGWRERWWDKLAHSEPPGDVQPWLDRLERWSAPDRFDQTYHQWHRTLVDLYTIARGLNEYVELNSDTPANRPEGGPRVAG